MINISNKYFEGKKILVTGGNGYIGSQLIKCLLKYKCKILIITKNKKIKKKNTKNIQYIFLNIQRESSWGKIIKLSDTIIHLSWNNSLLYADNNPEKSLEEAINPIKYMINMSKKFSIKTKFIFTSTASVYGMNTKNSFSENRKVQPITQYDKNKSLAESLLKKAHSKKVIEAICLRLSNVYGPSNALPTSKSRDVFNKMVRTAAKEKKITLYGNGSYLRDFIFIDDVVSAIIHSIVKKTTKNTIFNIGFGKSYTIKEFFEMTSQIIKKRDNKVIKISYIKWPEGSKDIDKRNFKCSINLFKKEASWKPKINLYNGIKKLIDSYSL